MVFVAVRFACNSCCWNCGVLDDHKYTMTTSSNPHHPTPHNTTPHHTTLHHTTSHHTILHHTTPSNLHHTTPSNLHHSTPSNLHHTMPHHTTPHHTLQIIQISPNNNNNKNNYKNNNNKSMTPVMGLLTTKPAWRPPATWATLDISISLISFFSIRIRLVLLPSFDGVITISVV